MSNPVLVLMALVLTAAVGCVREDRIRANIGGTIYKLDELPAQVEGAFALELDARQTRMLRAHLKKAAPIDRDAKGTVGMELIDLNFGRSLVKPLCPPGCRRVITGVAMEIDPLAPPGSPAMTSITMRCECGDLGGGTQINPGSCKWALKMAWPKDFKVHISQSGPALGVHVRKLQKFWWSCDDVNCSFTCRTWSESGERIDRETGYTYRVWYHYCECRGPGSIRQPNPDVRETRQ